MIKSIPSRIWINSYEIKFSYETKRKNKKEQTRQVKQLDENQAKRDFYIWLDTMKEKEPHRAMFNVNILDIAKIGGEFIEI